MLNNTITTVTINQLPQEYQDVYHLYAEKGATEELKSSFEQLGLDFPDEPTLEDTEAFKNYLIVSYLLEKGVSLWDITTFYPLSFLKDKEDMDGVIDAIVKTDTGIHFAVANGICDDARAALSEDMTLQQAKVTFDLHEEDDYIKVVLHFSKEYTLDEILTIATSDKLYNRRNKNQEDPSDLCIAARELVSDIRNLKDRTQVSYGGMIDFVNRMKDLLSDYANEIASEYCLDEYEKDELFLLDFKGILVSNTGDVLVIGEDEIPDVCITDELYAIIFD